MRIEYAPRAIADRLEIIGYYRNVAGPRIADSFDRRLSEVIRQLLSSPLMGPRVFARSGVRALLLRRFPYKVFYRTDAEVLQVLHIRHTARRPFRQAFIEST
jgi:toxin ParE1/3/4